jgi:hypothetical protein
VLLASLLNLEAVLQARLIDEGSGCVDRPLPPLRPQGTATSEESAATTSPLWERSHKGDLLPSSRVFAAGALIASVANQSSGVGTA